MLLSGKNAIITGGSRGIGASMVRAFVYQGAQVVFTYHNSEDSARHLVEELGAEKVKAVQCDGRNPETVQSTIAEAVAWLGGLDVLVNNAGITKDGLLLRMSVEDWDTVIDTNLKSSFLFSKGVLKYMMRTGGSIIHISSVIGVHGNGGQSNYAASKAGIIGFSKSIAHEMGGKQIRSNVIAPGFIDTDMTAGISETIINQHLNNIPLKRVGRPEEVADMAVFLASEMSTYVSGQVIGVCGGLNR
jgi:3-oxoacyl-[acyl-carrier protein] reductase